MRKQKEYVIGFDHAELRITQLVAGAQVVALEPRATTTSYLAKLRRRDIELLRPIPKHLRGTTVCDDKLSFERGAHFEVIVPDDATHFIATRDNFGFARQDKALPLRILGFFKKPDISEDELAAFCKPRSSFLGSHYQAPGPTTVTSPMVNEEDVPNKFSRRLVMKQSAAAMLAGTFCWITKPENALVELGRVSLGIGEDAGRSAPNMPTSKNFDILSYIRGEGQFSSDPYRKDVASLFHYMAAVATGREIPEKEFASHPELYLDWNPEFFPGQKGVLNVSAFNVAVSDPETLRILKLVGENVRINWDILPPREKKMTDATLQGRLLVPAIKDALDDDEIRENVRQLVAGLVTPDSRFRDTKTGAALYTVYRELTQPKTAEPPHSMLPVKTRTIRQPATRQGISRRGLLGKPRAG